MIYYLGMHITRDRKNKTIFINQPKSIDSLIVDYSLDISANSCPITPMRVDYSNRKSNNELHVSLDTLLSPQLITEFQSRVGASSYIAMQSRPGILFAVNTFARKKYVQIKKIWKLLTGCFTTLLELEILDCVFVVEKALNFMQL